MSEKWKHSAAFEGPDEFGSYKVWCVDLRNGDRFYMGMLDSTKNFPYEGDHVFNLDVEHVMEEMGEHVHYPLNVLREIGNFRPSDVN